MSKMTKEQALQVIRDFYEGNRRTKPGSGALNPKPLTPAEANAKLIELLRTGGGGGMDTFTGALAAELFTNHRFKPDEE